MTTLLILVVSQMMIGISLVCTIFVDPPKTGMVLIAGGVEALAGTLAIGAAVVGVDGAAGVCPSPASEYPAGVWYPAVRGLRVINCRSAVNSTIARASFRARVVRLSSSSEYWGKPPVYFFSSLLLSSSDGTRAVLLSNSSNNLLISPSLASSLSSIPLRSSSR
ncbi:hypothetical protein BGX38DRAFT_336258 [Terfezia claveryi]|nr:hypothetical protein BGX38DRAFT_336258 [Terfezia claveryi]